MFFRAFLHNARCFLLVNLLIVGGCGGLGQYASGEKISPYALVNTYAQSARDNCFQYSRKEKAVFDFGQALQETRFSAHRYVYSLIDGRKMSCKDCQRCFNTANGYDLKAFVHDRKEKKDHLAFNKMVLRHELVTPSSENTPALLKVWIRGSQRTHIDLIFYAYENGTYIANSRKADVSLYAGD
ncbi:MAG: hypothetical protein H6849_04400 [Alphaproteobacteria bacterium]|nr:MAG: hypothetical protein H6849_04400 [Alphaproteobacteria bacterium]